MLCREVAVMRRRADGYLNATQILKVAGFDKPQRTRVLEREVQKGEHEKVQGGYGKYQGMSTYKGMVLITGTWIPIERGLALAKQYGVEDLLRPIIDYEATAVSPPPAPKHAVAPPTKAKKEKKESTATPSKTGPSSSAALQAQAHLGTGKGKAANSTPDVEDDMSVDAEDSFGGLLGAIQADDDDSSLTPSPINSPVAFGNEFSDATEMDGNGRPRKRPAEEMEDDPYSQLVKARGQSAVHTPKSSPRVLTHASLPPEQYTDIILNYFISETSQVPALLINPPPDYDPNSTIDEDGHTALHWACAMGRIRVVKLLLTAGASIFATNNAEQTPLMRSVMFSNNYDVRKFPELYELLHRSTLNIDKSNRTVFHHIANLALTKGKPHAARYYMETILSRLSDYPQELADVINFQDEEGETSLTLAARARSRRLVKCLLDHGADPKMKNRDFKSTEDYILEDERFRGSPSAPGATNGNGAGASTDQVLYNSEAARIAGGSGMSDIASNMQSLARSMDAEFLAKDRETTQAKAMLTSIHAEITESSRALGKMSEQIAPLEESRREVEQLRTQLKNTLLEKLRSGYEEWNQGEQGREARWRAGQDPMANGEDYSDLQSTTAPAREGEEEALRWEIEDQQRRRGDLLAKLVKSEAEVSCSVDTSGVKLTNSLVRGKRLLSIGN
jgi:transcription factor MBP1